MTMMRLKTVEIIFCVILVVLGVLTFLAEKELRVATFCTWMFFSSFSFILAVVALIDPGRKLWAGILLFLSTSPVLMCIGRFILFRMHR